MKNFDNFEMNFLSLFKIGEEKIAEVDFVKNIAYYSPVYNWGVRIFLIYLGP